MKNLFKKLKQPKVLKPLFLTLSVFLIVGAFFYLEKVQNRIFIENSIVSAPIINIAPLSPGKLSQVDIWENETIKKGDSIGVVGGQTIYADSDGLIITLNNQIGAIFGPQIPLAQMVNPKDMRIASTLDENKGLNQIKVGQVASFTVDALPGKTFWGYVDEISPTAKQTQLSFSISSERPTQQFVVFVRFAAPKYPEIKNGMSAKTTVYTKTP